MSKGKKKMSVEVTKIGTGRISPTVSRSEAAAIIGCTPNNVDNYARQGLLTNIGEAGRYGRPKFLRSQCEKLRDNRPAKGRPVGIPNPRGGRKKKIRKDDGRV